MRVSLHGFGNALALPSAPIHSRMTRSIRAANGDLGLEKVTVIYPGTKSYLMADLGLAVPLAQLGAPEGLSAYLPP